MDKTSPAKTSPLSQLWFLLKYSGRFFWQTDAKTFIGVMVLNAVTSIVIVPNLYLDKLFLDTLIGNLGQPLTQEVTRMVILIVGARFGLQLFARAARRLSGYYARYFFWKNFQRIESLVGVKYATIPVPVLEDPAFKDRYQKVERESLNKLQRIGENYLRIPQYVTGIISSLSFFALGQPWVIAVSIAALLPGIWVERVFIKKDYQLETSVSRLHRKRGMYYYYLARSRSYLESRILNIHQYLSRQVSVLWEEIINKRLSLLKSRRMAGFSVDSFESAVSYSFDAVFGLQALAGRITIGTAQAYIRAISTFKQSTSDLTTAIMDMYESYLYLDDLVWFLNLETPYYNEGGAKLTGAIEKIEFEHVWFTYPGTQNPILKDVSFVINPGENVAIVGKNGAGKTTLVKLLAGFYVPDKGRVLVNGHSVETLHKPSYWKKLSALFQESDAFGITIKETLAIGNIQESGNEAKIKKLARTTQIDEWIEKLPLQYDNPIGRDFEQGVAPSTGQWQKIVIARTLFKDGDVMILDEPTSNVDPEAEEKIFKEILEVGKEKIIIFISHRFSTVRQADRIIVMEDGTVTEQGSHTELMQQEGTYARLFRLQAKSYQ